MSTSNTTAPTVDTWTVPPRCQGQIVEVAYGTDEDGEPWQRVHDRSCGEITYTRGYWTDDSKWEPWNAEPTAIDWEAAEDGDEEAVTEAEIED